MSVDKRESRGAGALAIKPRNWEPVIGLSVVLTMALTAPLMYLVAAGIRASYLPAMG